MLVIYVVDIVAIRQL